MALNWNLEKCKDLEEIKSKEEWGVTESIIWTTMITAIGHITENNWKEFLFRVKVIERLSGPLLNKHGEKGVEPMYFTPEMIKKRIGLHTNVSTETRAAWMKGYVKNLLQNIDREIERENQKEEKIATQI
jgi:hypothetical protein